MVQFDFQVALYVTLAFLNFGLMVITVVRRDKNSILWGTRKIFGLMTFGVTLWMLVSLFNHVKRDEIWVTWGTRVAHFLGLFILFTPTIFVLSFVASKRRSLRLWAYLLAVLYLAVGAITLVSPWVIAKGIPYNPTHHLRESLILGPLYPLFGLVSLIGVATFVYLFYYVIRTGPEEHKERLKVLFGSILLSLIFVVFFNLILPWLGYPYFYDIGIASTLFFTLGAAYVLVYEYPFSFRYTAVRFISIVAGGLFLFFLSWGVQRLEQLVFKWDITDFLDPRIILFGWFIASILTFVVLKGLIFLRFGLEKLFGVRVYRIRELLTGNKFDKVFDIQTLLNFLEHVRKYLGLHDICVYVPSLDLAWSTSGKIELPVPPLELIRSDPETLGFKKYTEALYIKGCINRSVIASVIKDKDGTKLGFICFKGRLFAKEELSAFAKLIGLIQTAILRLIYMNKLAAANRELELKVKERTEKLASALERLKKANRRLRALDKAKSDFISVVSHQLRTPVSVIMGYIEMLRNGELGKCDPSASKAIERIYKNMDRLRLLISDIVNVNKLELGKLELIPEKFDIVSMLDELVEKYRPLAREKVLYILFVNLTEKEKVFIYADRAKIYEAISHIIDNAIKYTKSGGVQVGLQEGQDYITIFVKDTGIGIDEKYKDMIFERFVRLPEAKKMSPEGLGIGLYLAKNIIKAHGGKLYFVSKKDEGTTFYIVLPKKLRK